MRQNCIPMDNAKGAADVPSDYSGKMKQRRSRKACRHCQMRKIRCDVQMRGIPCSNCSDQATSCTIPQRKNQRRESTYSSSAISPEQSSGLILSPSLWSNQDHSPSVVLPEPSSGGSQSAVAVWGGNPNALGWDEANVAREALARHSRESEMSSSIDFSNLTDFEDIFAFTNYSLPVVPPVEHRLACNGIVNIQPGMANLPIRTGADGTSDSFYNIALLPLADQQFLESQGCFDLPPVSTLRQIMRFYFQFVHPNIPIVREDEFWSLWADDEFTLGNFSILVVRAMIFAAVHFTELDMLSNIGFSNKREARLACYKQAKLIFDFGIERDAVANAQACLLLTYYAPKYDNLRVNSCWLMHATRFARIARAESFHLIQDAVQATVLKRLWWGVLFRDRILSLGLRRAPQIGLASHLEDDNHLLQANDFQSELGKSPVHNHETQLRLVEVITATCSFIRCLTPAVQVLYEHERINDRLACAVQSLPETLKRTQHCLDELRWWHECAIRSFPVPVSLDDAQEAVCIFANMLFCYYSSAVFALNVHCVLLRETLSAPEAPVTFEDSQESLALAMKDIGNRTQELVQVRLAKFLPTSASAFMALPLLLQAINVAAARGSGLENVEGRKLDVFKRILTSQQVNFDGSDFCADVLTNIVAYAKDNETFLIAMMTWRDGKDAVTASPSRGELSKRDNKIKFDWINLVNKRPRLFLRLILYLDSALCTGGIPQDEDFPHALRRSQM